MSTIASIWLVVIHPLTDLLIFSDLWIALAPPDQCGQESSTRLSWKKNSELR